MPKLGAKMRVVSASVRRSAGRAPISFSSAASTELAIAPPLHALIIRAPATSASTSSVVNISGARSKPARMR